MQPARRDEFFSAISGSIHAVFSFPRNTDFRRAGRSVVTVERITGCRTHLPHSRSSRPLGPVYPFDSLLPPLPLRRSPHRRTFLSIGPSRTPGRCPARALRLRADPFNLPRRELYTVRRHDPWGEGGATDVRDRVGVPPGEFTVTHRGCRGTDRLAPCELPCLPIPHRLLLARICHRRGARRRCPIDQIVIAPAVIRSRIFHATIARLPAYVRIYSVCPDPRTGCRDVR
jgi:hypothetical protein